MTRRHSTHNPGFTIVELLVVIVVIGILAAITIVAFNGLQHRARVTEISSDLSGVARKFKLHHVDNGVYPTTVTSSAESGITYHVSVKNTEPQYFCVTGYKYGINYHVKNSSAPASGSCVGQSLDGSPLADNLASNPSLEVNTANWNPLISGTTMKRVTSGPGIVAGTAALEINVTTANQSGVNLLNNPASPSTTYTASGYVTLISGDPTGFLIRTGSSCGTQSYKHITGLVPNQPQRVSTTWTQCATANGIGVWFWRGGTSTAPAVIRVDAVMVETGSTATPYSD